MFFLFLMFQGILGWIIGDLGTSKGWSSTRVFVTSFIIGMITTSMAIKFGVM